MISEINIPWRGWWQCGIDSVQLHGVPLSRASYASNRDEGILLHGCSHQQLPRCPFSHTWFEQKTFLSWQRKFLPHMIGAKDIFCHDEGNFSHSWLEQRTMLSWRSTDLLLEKKFWSVQNITSQWYQFHFWVKQVQISGLPLIWWLLKISTTSSWIYHLGLTSQYSDHLYIVLTMVGSHSEV